VFVEVNTTKADPIKYGLRDVIITTSDNILASSNHKVNLRLPKYFKIFALFERRNKVAKEDKVKRIPTYVSEIMSAKNVELTYADRAICKVKRNDRTYIRFILEFFILIKLYILNNTGITIGLFAVFWKRNLDILSPSAVFTMSKFTGFIPIVSSSTVFLIIKRT